VTTPIAAIIDTIDACAVALSWVAADLRAMQAEPPPSDPPPPVDPHITLRLHDDVISGPSRDYCNARLRLPWARGQSGDWLDADGQPNGPKSTASIPLKSAGAVQCDVTAIARTSRQPAMLVRYTGTNFPCTFEGSASAQAPMLRITTTAGVIAIPAVATAHWAPSTARPLGGAASWRVGGQFVAAIQFDARDVVGDVESATLELTCTQWQRAGTLLIDALDMPRAVVPPPIEWPAAQWREGALIAQDWPQEMAARFNPSAAVQHDAVRDAWIASAMVGKGKSLSVDVRLSPVRGMADGSPDRVISAALMRYEILLEHGFASTADGTKLPATDARLGYWVATGGGYWQSVSGNGGDPGDGRLHQRNGRREYEGSGTRILALPSSTYPDAHADLVPLAVYSYHVDQTGPNPPAWPCSVFMRRGQWTVIEVEQRMNSLTGEPDALGNREAVADGVLRVRVNGVLACERTDVRWRRHPDIGVSAAWVDVYHGGVQVAPVDMPYRLGRVVMRALDQTEKS
jgi:hypothetical protein